MGTVDGKGVQGPHDAAEGVAADQASRCERLWMAPQSKSGILKLRWAQRVCNQVCLARGPALIWGCSGASKRPSPLLCTCFPALVTSRLVKHVGTPPMWPYSFTAWVHALYTPLPPLSHVLAAEWSSDVPNIWRPLLRVKITYTKRVATVVLQFHIGRARVAIVKISIRERSITAKITNIFTICIYSRTHLTKPGDFF